MNHQEKLLSIFSKPSLPEPDKEKLSADCLNSIQAIAKKSFEQKGVFTVLVTLIVHKILFPNQDIRFHQGKMEKGFSGRSIDTKYITPTLKELKLPAMAESGWLTRSLEQPYPYTLDYEGRIRDLEVKTAFLDVIDFIQKDFSQAENILKILLDEVKNISDLNKVKPVRLENPDKLDIQTVVAILQKQFSFKYQTTGGAKLPVLAFYAIYKALLPEIKRYENCFLKELSSHTSCDATSNSAGDIEIFNNKGLLEVLEIKLNRMIDFNMLLVAWEKILKHNPKRYYILSTGFVKSEDIKKIAKLIEQVKTEHGCQIILNGVIPTLKYYLRLILSLEKFINDYSQLIFEDIELKTVHKEKWNEILKSENFS